MILTVTLNPALDLAMEVPTLEFGEMVRAHGVRKEAAGKGINVSRVLKLLGEPTAALAILGQSSVGEFQRLARDGGIPIVYILVPGETRTNIHIQEGPSGRGIKVNQPGLTVDGEHFDHFALLFRQQLRAAKMVCLGGSLPPGLGPESYARLAELARKEGVPVIIDAEGPALRDALAARPLMAKPNRRELAATLGRRLDTLDDVVEAARTVQKEGARSVLVTDSGGAVVVIWDDEIHVAHPPRVEIKGTVGAGDSLTAGVAAMLSRGKEIGEALRFGCAVGTAACMTSDTMTARMEDIEWLVPRVVVERVG